jgi:mono/diheme cytochrome c family protein
VAGPEGRIIATVLHGLSGPITVNGEEWNGAMPPQGANLDDGEIADVLSYVRSQWGNSAPPVEAGTVGTLRARLEGHGTWTQYELATEFPNESD